MLKQLFYMLEWHWAFQLDLELLVEILHQSKLLELTKWNQVISETFMKLNHILSLLRLQCCTCLSLYFLSFLLFKLFFCLLNHLASDALG